MEDINAVMQEIKVKAPQALCREVLSITDTIDVLRSKWTVEILTAIICGSTRFKDILASVKRISEKVLAERLRQMQEDGLIEKHEYYGYPPRVEYQLTEHGKRLYVIIYNMTEWGLEHRSLMLG